MPARVRGFYLNVLRPPHGGVYARLAQSHWDQGHVRTRVLVNFGRVTEEQLSALRSWIDTNPLTPQRASPDRLLLNLRDLRCRRSWQYGREALGHFLWYKLGLHQIVLEALSGIPGKAVHERAIETMVVNRLCDPASKYGVLRWFLNHSGMGFLLGGRLPHHENALYRAMDVLRARHETVERKVWEKIVRPLTATPQVHLHDMTSSYCERDAGGLVQYGYNRDKVEGCPQVNWGMVMTTEGFPVTLEVYPGNTKDETTVHTMRLRLERTFGLKGGIYVGDRGMHTDDNVKELVAHGFKTILAEKLSENKPMEMAQKARLLAPVAVSESLVAREVAGEDGRRWIVLLNEKRREIELETLERKRGEGEAILKAWRKRAGNEDHHEVLKGCQQELAKAGVLNLFEIAFDEDTFQGLTAEMKVRWHRLKEWAGWWVLSTDSDLPAEEVATLYQRLSVVETGWRVLKSVLEVRPLNHHLDKRIEGHLILCELAYLMEKYIDHRVREGGLKEDGGVLTGVRVIEKFGNVVVNEQEVAGTEVRFHQITEFTGEQKKMLETVGLDPKVVHRGWSRLDPAGMVL